MTTAFSVYICPFCSTQLVAARVGEHVCKGLEDKCRQWARDEITNAALRMNGAPENIRAVKFSDRDQGALKAERPSDDDWDNVNPVGAGSYEGLRLEANRLRGWMEWIGRYGKYDSSIADWTKRALAGEGAPSK